MIDKFKFVIDITRDNFRNTAIRKAKELAGDNSNYVIKVGGKHTTILIHSGRLNSSYRCSLCKSIDYDNKYYTKQLDVDIVRVCMSPERVYEKPIINESDIKLIGMSMTRMEEVGFLSYIDYSGFEEVK